MTLKFRPEDFLLLEKHNGIYLDIDIHLEASKFAQKAFDKWLKEQPIVYGSEEHSWTMYKKDHDTHQAYFVDKQPIQKCLHPPEKVKWVRINNMYANTPGWTYECECKARLEPATYRELK